MDPSPCHQNCIYNINCFGQNHEIEKCRIFDLHLLLYRVIINFVGDLSLNALMGLWSNNELINSSLKIENVVSDGISSEVEKELLGMIFVMPGV